MRVRVVLGVLIAAALIGLTVHVARLATRVDASSLLRMSRTNTRNLSYAGVVTTTVFYCGKEMQTRSIVQRRGMAERIEYLSNPVNGVVVISADGETRTLRPDSTEAVTSASPIPHSEAGELDLLLKNYRATSSGTERVAGVVATVVDLVPLHPGNPTKRLWVDRNTGVVLKSEDRTGSGQLRCRMEFTRINYSADVPDDLFIVAGKSQSAQHDMTASEVGKIVGVKVTLPAYLPAGYQLSGVTIHKCECECGHNAAHLRYTDGMNSLSVFETPSHPAYNGPMCKVHCPSAGQCEVRNAEQAQVATASAAGKSIVVVADLPKDEIERVAKSIP